jgi:hypothetical protein
MSAAALLDELAQAGVRLSLAGDDLRYHTHPGVSIAPFRARIQATKSELLKELLQRQIVATVNAEPERFDCERYDRLWRQWQQRSG